MGGCDNDPSDEEREIRALRAQLAAAEAAVAALARFSTRLLHAVELMVQRRRASPRVKLKAYDCIEVWFDGHAHDFTPTSKYRGAVARAEKAEKERDAYGKEWDQSREQSTMWHDCAAKLERELKGLQGVLDHTQSQLDMHKEAAQVAGDDMLLATEERDSAVKRAEFAEAAVVSWKRERNVLLAELKTERFARDAADARANKAEKNLHELTGAAKLNRVATDLVDVVEGEHVSNPRAQRDGGIQQRSAPAAARGAIEVEGTRRGEEGDPPRDAARGESMTTNIECTPCHGNGTASPRTVAGEYVEPVCDACGGSGAVPPPPAKADLDAGVRLARRALSEPAEDGNCSDCGCTFELDDGAEPTPLCHPCAQTLLVLLAHSEIAVVAHVNRLENEVARLTRERNALGEAIGKAVVTSGMVRPDVSLTGPHLIQFVGELATMPVAERKVIGAKLVEILRVGRVADIVRFATTLTEGGAS